MRSWWKVNERCIKQGGCSCSGCRHGEDVGVPRELALPPFFIIFVNEPFESMFVLTHWRHTSLRSRNCAVSHKKGMARNSIGACLIGPKYSWSSLFSTRHPTPTRTEAGSCSVSPTDLLDSQTNTQVRGHTALEEFFGDRQRCSADSIHAACCRLNYCKMCRWIYFALHVPAAGSGWTN